MGNDRPDYPEVDLGDPEEVRAALENGRAAWDSKNEKEALRWLQRATLAATKANISKRAGTLAQSVSTLSQNLGANLLNVPLLSKPTPGGASAGTDFSDTTVVDGPADVAVPKILAASRQKPRQALRVAVEPAPGEPTLLRVRILDDGQAAAAGTHEALLVAIEPGADFFKRKE